MAVKWQVRDYLYVTAETVVGIFSLLGNALVLLAIKRYRLLRTPTNCFIGSLAAADALVGLVIPPTVVVAYFGLPKNFHGCVFLNSVVVLITNISILNMMAVALDRFIAVKSPFFYQRVISVNRAMVVVVFTWILATVMGLIPLMGWHLDKEGFTICAFTRVIDLKFMVYFNFFGVFTPLLLFMLIVYLYLFYIIRQQHRFEKTQMVCVKTKQMRQAEKQRKRDVRGAKGLAYVIILFAVCWIPLHITNTLNVLSPPDKRPQFSVVLVAVILSHANSVVNPFLYAFSSSRFKHALKKILCCKKGVLSRDSFSETHWNHKRKSTLGPDLFKQEVMIPDSALPSSDTLTSGTSSTSQQGSAPLRFENWARTEVFKEDQISRGTDQEEPVANSNSKDNGHPLAREDSVRRNGSKSGWPLAREDSLRGNRSESVCPLAREDSVRRNRSESIWMTPSSMHSEQQQSNCSVDSHAVTGGIWEIYTSSDLGTVHETSVDAAGAVSYSVKDSKSIPKVEQEASSVIPTSSREQTNIVSEMHKRLSLLLPCVPGQQTKTSDSQEPGHDTKKSDSQKPGHDTKKSDSQKPGHDTKKSDSQKPGHATKKSDSQKPGHDTKKSDSQKPGHATNKLDSRKSRHDIEKIGSKKLEQDAEKLDNKKSEHDTEKIDSKKLEQDTEKLDSKKSEHDIEKIDSKKLEQDTEKMDNKKSEHDIEKMDNKKSGHNIEKLDSHKHGQNTKKLTRNRDRKLKS